MPATTMETWIDSLQASGRYSFLRSEASSTSGLSAEAANKALQRLSKRGRVAKLKDYFYVIVPLEYRSAGAPPASWFVGDLMAAMRLPYYVGLLSAAALHGASHHQPQQVQVFTDRSVRAVSAGRTRIRFFVSKYIRKAAVVEMKTPTGSIRVASPETATIDLVRFARTSGGLDHVTTVVAELAPSLNPKRLMAAVRLVDDVPNAQRLGYILDQVRQRRLAEPIHVWLGRRKPRTLPLRSGRPVGDALENRRWHLLINGAIEAEA